MLLSKIKLVAAVLMTIVLAGAGVAWVSYRADAGEPPPGTDAPPASRGGSDRRAEDERVAADRRRAEQQKRLDRATDLLAVTEAKLAKQEEQWLEEIIEARLKVMELQADIKARERELDEGSKTSDPLADVRLRTLMADRDRAALQLAEARRVTPDQHQRILEALEEKLAARQQELEKEAAQRKRERDEGLAKLRNLRRDLVVAEEKVRALQRRQDGEREEARRDREEQARRVRQLRQALDDTELPAPADGRPAADLERKLDQILRELAELRRSLRPPADRRPER
jgi:septal ring factor EnvC (AmiA/AmiB activator)